MSKKLWNEITPTAELKEEEQKLVFDWFPVFEYGSCSVPAGAEDPEEPYYVKLLEKAHWPRERIASLRKQFVSPRSMYELRKSLARLYRPTRRGGNLL